MSPQELGSYQEHDRTLIPPELSELLKSTDYACITQSTSIGTAMVIKIPRVEIDSVRGTIPIHIRHELYTHPLAPVIRMVLTLHDQPDQPLALETFINIADDQQRADFAALVSQEQLPLLFYDEAVSHQLSKVIALTNQEALAAILSHANDYLSKIPQEHFNFDMAKAAVIQSTRLYPSG